MLKLFGIILVISCGFIANAKHLTEQPSYIQPCKTADSKCFTDSMQTLFAQLKTGIPGLTKVPTIEPLKLNKINIIQDQSQALNVSAVLKDVVIKGMGDSIVKQAKYDTGKGTFSFDMEFPKLRMVSDYELKGRILLLQLNGKGKMYMASDNVEARLNVLTELHEQNGEQFFTIKAVRMHYKLNNVKTKLENLFNGNKQLEESANQLFNENWRELNEALEPVLEKTAQDILKLVMRRIFAYIPAKFIFSDLKANN